jgi:LysR family transcriptional regulator, transcriptional activator for dmlA
MNESGLSEAEAFLAVADAGGFGAAQSTISRRIAVLEGRLGLRLIERTTRYMALTEAGLSYASDLRDILLRLRHADARVQRSAVEPEGLLRITMPTALGRACVVPCLSRLARRHPSLRFEVDLSDRYADLLEAGYDVAVRLASTSQSGIAEQRIASVVLRMCASPRYVASHGLVSEPSQFDRHDCLALRTYAPRASWHVVWRGKSAEVSYVPKMVVSDLFALHDFCRAGLGIAVLPMYAAAAALADGSLVNVAPAIAVNDLVIYAAYARDRMSLPKISALLTELRSIQTIEEPIRDPSSVEDLPAPE